MSIIEKHTMDYDIVDIVDTLENLYSNHLIYRTIIVCDDNDLDNYKCQLENNDHNVYVLTEYNKVDNVNYDTIDTRIFIIKETDFINFVKKYKDNDGRYFYNMVFFASQKNKEQLTKEYRHLINNDNIII
jgi:hypothetical protein